jgi:hypothetical protein
MLGAMLALVASGMLLLPAAAPASNAAPEAAPVRTVDLAKITEISLDPPTINLNDPRARQQILVTGKLNGALIDLTDLATFQTSNEKVVKLSERQEALPAGDGTAEILIKAGPAQAKVAVKVSNTSKGRMINFPNEIVPIFTKLTCNGGGCHGKSGGQNGFRLSLLGFEPRDDYEYLVKESRGRRILPSAPEDSLLIRKPTGKVPHGGGKLLKAGDPNYQLLIDWISQGTPYGKDEDAVVTKIEVFPNHRFMYRGGVK